MIIKPKFTASVLLTAGIVFGLTNTAFAQLKVTEPGRSQPQQNQEDSDFNSRQQKRKEQFKIKLSSQEKASLKEKCKAAQGNVSSVAKRANGMSTSRQQVYGNIQQSLSNLVKKLEAKGLNTQSLVAETSKLDQAIADFNSNLSTYLLAISDLEEINCQDDPEAFKAALLDARQMLKQLTQDSSFIKEILKSSVRPELVNLKKSFNAAANSNTEQTNADKPEKDKPSEEAQ